MCSLVLLHLKFKKHIFLLDVQIVCESNSLMSFPLNCYDYIFDGAGMCCVMI